MRFDANYRGYCTWKAKKQKVMFSKERTDKQVFMTDFSEFRSRNNKAQRATRGGGPMASGQLAVRSRQKEEMRGAWGEKPPRIALVRRWDDVAEASMLLTCDLLLEQSPIIPERRHNIRRD